MNLTKGFPRDENNGLRSQVRQASVSVPSNISEGAAGRSVTQFRNFLSVAIGSLNEVSTQLEIAYRVGYLDRHKLDEAESRVSVLRLVSLVQGFDIAHGYQMPDVSANRRSLSLMPLNKPP